MSELDPVRTATVVIREAETQYSASALLKFDSHEFPFFVTKVWTFTWLYRSLLFSLFARKPFWAPIRLTWEPLVFTHLGQPSKRDRDSTWLVSATINLQSQALEQRCKDKSARSLEHNARMRLNYKHSNDKNERLEMRPEKNIPRR